MKPHPIPVPWYGSADDSDQFQYFYIHSPCHNFKRKTTYTAALFLTGDADTRIDLLHARKVTAFLQVLTGSNRPIMLSYDT